MKDAEGRQFTPNPDSRSVKADVLPTTPIRELDPIEEQEGEVFEAKDLARYVEPALLPACQELFDRGIITFTSSANRKHFLENGTIIPAEIVIDYDALSPENRKVVEDLKLEIIEANERNRHRSVGLKIPLSPESTIQSTQEAALEITHRFLPQAFPVPEAHTVEWYARNYVGYTEVTPEILQRCEESIRSDDQFIYNEKEKIFAYAAEVKRWEESVKRNERKEEQSE